MHYFLTNMQQNIQITGDSNSHASRCQARDWPVPGPGYQAAFEGGAGAAEAAGLEQYAQKAVRQRYKEKKKLPKGNVTANCWPQL